MLNDLISDIYFQVIPLDAPLLLSIRNKNSPKVMFDSLQNFLIQGDLRVPAIRKFGHPFLFIPGVITTHYKYYNCYLTDQELRQLHRKFDHLSTLRLIKEVK